jgi:hypothetical protein
MIECCYGWLRNKGGEIGARQGANRSQVEHLARICNAVGRRFSSSFVPSSMKHYTRFSNQSIDHTCTEKIFHIRLRPGAADDASHGGRGQHLYIATRQGHNP